MDVIRFFGDDVIEFRSNGVNVQLRLDHAMTECARGDRDATGLLMWAQIAATREQTAAIREFTQLAKTQAKRADELMESRSPESILELVTKGFPEVAKALQDAGIGPHPTGTRTIVPGANGG